MAAAVNQQLFTTKDTEDTKGQPCTGISGFVSFVSFVVAQASNVAFFTRPAIHDQACPAQSVLAVSSR